MNKYVSDLKLNDIVRVDEENDEKRNIVIDRLVPVGETVVLVGGWYMDDGENFDEICLVEMIVNVVGEYEED